MFFEKFGIIIAGVISIIGIGIYFILPNYLANMFLYPNRQPLVKNPGDYGLKFEDVRFTTEDSVSIAGWLIHGSGDNVIIVGHPATFTRYGFSKAHQGLIKSGYKKEVEFIPAAKHLVDAGYSVLMYDQRNHGESGSSPNNGPHDGGPEAWRDIVAAAEFIAQHPNFPGQDIGLLSFCQSSLISMAAMTKSPDALYESGVKTMIAVQPISLAIFFKQYGLPGFILNRINKKCKSEGAPLEGQNPLLYAGQVSVPTLFVQNINDPWSDMEHSNEIYNSIPTEKEAIWLDEEERHRFLAYNWFNDHPDKMVEWFDKYLK